MIVDPTYHQALTIRQCNTPEYKDYRHKWYTYPKLDIVTDFPIHVDLELNTTCNLQCPMCIRETFPPSPALMPLELAMKVIDECGANGTLAMKYQCRGEPLLHPFLSEIVTYAKEKGILEAMFNTNATLLTPEMSKKLLLAGLDKIICSVDTHDPHLYKKIRVGADLDSTYRNINWLRNYKESILSPTPYIRIQMIDFPDTHEMQSEALKFWMPLADEISFIDLLDFHKIELKKPFPQWKCAQPWQRLLVLANGDVIPCTGLYTDAKVIGNVYETTLKEIWHGKEIEHIRNCHRKGQSHKLSMCRICPMRRRFYPNTK